VEGAAMTLKLAPKIKFPNGLGTKLFEAAEVMDVFFAPGASPEGDIDCGWIEITANKIGRDAVQKVFPTADFRWREGDFIKDFVECGEKPENWAGWLAFVPHIRSCAAEIPNTLPKRLR
jgi:hypothetical protein